MSSAKHAPRPSRTNKCSQRTALQNLGYKVGRSTIQRILLENGIDPAPTRGM